MFLDDSLHGGLRLSAHLRDRMLVVEATGIREFVAETGEQLAWLGAALRHAPSDMEPAIYCIPVLNIGDQSPTVAKSKMVEQNGCFLECSIQFKFEECEPSHLVEANGQCWYGLFGRPVIALGFPTPWRPKMNTGLEIPLAMMTALIRTKYIQIFGGKTFIKGFSAMLVPTEASDGMLMWHLLHTGAASRRISYLDCHLEHATVGMTELGSYRHVVGWCSEVISHVGKEKPKFP